MRSASSETIFAEAARSQWHAVEHEIWSRSDGALDFVPLLSILTTLWDQPRWLEAYHLYDQRGSALFEQICELPEYYLTRTENAILEAHARTIIGSAPVRCIAELGAGFSKKTAHLLSEQARQRGPSLFVPIDVSISALLASRAAVHSRFPAITFHGLHARYEDAIAAIDRRLPTLFVFLGSTIGNFNHTELPRFFQELSAAMGPGDFLLLGADRVKEVDVLERAYNDSRGLTAEFILNVFENINTLLKSDFDRSKMRYLSGFDRDWQQIEMYAVADETHDVHFPAQESSFRWHKDEKILVEISRKFEPGRLQGQLRFFGLSPVLHCTDAREWFSVLLLKKEN